MFYKDLDVIIPTYNRAKYLKVALESLFESIATWRKTIILNNASTDNTLEVIKIIKEKYPDRIIEVITNENNIGNANNFKKTQEIVSNKYVAIFHDDDAIHPEYIDRAMQIIMNSNKNIVLVSGGATALYNVNNKNWYLLSDNYWEYPADKNLFLQLILARPTFCCAIYKSEIYKKINYRPEKYGKLHDIIFMSEISRLGTSIYLHGECVRWRQHIGSDSNTLKTGPFPEEIINVLIQQKKLFNDELELKGVKRFFINIIFKAIFFNWAYFLYQWSDLKRFQTWDEFKVEMKKRKIFTSIDYLLIDKLIDIIFNPCIKKLAKICSERYFRTYAYRVGSF